MKYAVLTILLLTGCTPAVKSALDIVAPLLVDALTSEISRKFGEDAVPDPATAVCIGHDGSALEDYPEDFPHRGWVICFMDRVGE